MRPKFFPLILLFLAPCQGKAVNVCKEEWVRSFRCKGERPPPIAETKRYEWCNSEDFLKFTHAQPGTAEEHVQKCIQTYPGNWEQICHEYRTKCTAVPDSTGGERGAKCSGAAGCFEEARRAQASGISDLQRRRADYQDTITQAEKAMAGALSGAAEILANWEQASGNDPQASALRDQDQRLVENAIRSMTGKENTFTPDQAAKAHDSGLQQQLGFAAESRQTLDILKAGAEDLSRQEAKLAELNQQTGLRVAGLDAVPGTAVPDADAVAGAPAPVPAIKAGAAGNQASDVTGTRDASLQSQAGTKVANAPGAQASSEGTSGAVGASPVPGRDGPSLRELLGRHLGQRGGAGERAAKGATDANDGEILGTFIGAPGQLDRAPAGASVTAVSERGKAESIGALAFSLGADSAEEIRRLVAGNEAVAAELAYSEGHEIPGLDSPDLFSRVHDVHRACVVRKCVR